MCKVIPVTFSASRKAEVYSDYIACLEDEGMVSPKIEFALGEHRYCRRDDLFSSGQNFHPPDSVCAAALAWYGRGQTIEIVAPDSSMTKRSAWRSFG